MNPFVARLAAACLGMTALSPTMADPPSPAPPRGDNAGTLDFCVFLMSLEQFEEMNLGECMSFNSVSEDGFAPHGCDALREFGLLDDLGYDSYSDCVRNY